MGLLYMGLNSDLETYLGQFVHLETVSGEFDKVLAHGSFKGLSQLLTRWLSSFTNIWVNLTQYGSVRTKVWVSFWLSWYSFVPSVFTKVQVSLTQFWLIGSVWHSLGSI